MEIKVSIIVPVYNAENYIKRCIDSIIAQDYPNWELIIIDDGSSDSSGDRCDRYSLLDKRIRVVHKPNGGVSSARNTGLKAANGDWISFVDADDYVKPSFLSSFLAKLSDNVEYVSMGFENLNSQSFPVISIIDTNNALEGLFSSGAYKYMQPWAKFFKKNKIDELKLMFDTKLSIGEDKLFILQYLLGTTECRFLNDSLYMYNDGIGLSTKRYQPDVELDLAEKTHTAIDSLICKYRPESSISYQIRKNEKAELFRVLYAVGMSPEFNKNKKILQDLLNLYSEVIPVLDKCKLSRMERIVIKLLYHCHLNSLIIFLKMNYLFSLLRKDIKKKVRFI